MVYDGNGNIVGIVDGGTGKTLATMVYSPFGEMIAREGDAERDRYGFSTKWGDGETGTCYYGYRFYAPYTGRWLSPDPIEERGGLNVGGFVANDPVGRIDGLGLLDIRSASTDPLTSVTSDGCSINLVMGHMLEIGLPALDRFLSFPVSGGCSGPRIGFQTCGSDYLSAQVPKEGAFVIPDHLWGRGDSDPMSEDEERRANELRRSLPNVRNLPYISRSNTTTASVTLQDGSRLLDYVKANACKETCCKTVKIVAICSQQRTQLWDKQAAASVLTAKSLEPRSQLFHALA
jgi:RHS repeat-associated protein